MQQLQKPMHIVLTITTWTVSPQLWLRTPDHSSNNNKRTIVTTTTTITTTNKAVWNVRYKAKKSPKKDEPYSHAITYFRTKTSFALLRIAIICFRFYAVVQKPVTCLLNLEFWGLSHYSPPLWYNYHVWRAIGYLTTKLGGL